ncbi:MAG: ASKHA domain-containing protein [Candidatus Nanopelagicales bacterium]|nr:ASKHA domain-containing protein [Candidatus Nanopelagicales bacterium]
MTNSFAPFGSLNEESTNAHMDSPLVRVDISFEPSNKTVRVPTGVSVFDAASWNGLAIDSTCGGNGTCKKCKVQILEGSVPVTNLDWRAFKQEELDAGWRLACVSHATNTLKVSVPPLTTRPKASTVGVGRQVILRPSVIKRFIEVVEPSLTDQRSDLRRVLDEIDDLTVNIDPQLIKELPKVLRCSEYKVTCVVVADKLIAIEPGDTTAALYAIAYDLGTTTVVASLMDLSTGTPMAVASMLNKQQPFGADVISRISATMLDEDALDKLQELAHTTLGDLTNEVCAEAGIAPEEVFEIAIAGNATMVQIALGIDPEPLGVAPFIMATESYPTYLANELGVFLHPRARAYLFPALGAYVGGDIISGALATGMDRDKRIRLFIDIGTNCELVLGDGERLIATAAPAGPAFEAASIRCGMRAAAGAVEVVTITDTDVLLEVIEDAEPIGLCGSGLVDAVAELAKMGIADPSGRFITDEAMKDKWSALAHRLVTIDKERVFILSFNDNNEAGVFLSQRDVRELQFAKAAISTGWKMLLEEFGVAEEDIAQVLLAGSFGTYLSATNAIAIGLVPKIPALRVISAGNVAGEGAKMVLLSGPERNGATTLMREIAYLELSDRTDFNDRFVDELAFPI